MGNMCPFCQWPSIVVTCASATDPVGNDFYHGKCKGCNCEVVYFRRAEKDLTLPDTA